MNKVDSGINMSVEEANNVDDFGDFGAAPESSATEEQLTEGFGEKFDLSKEESKMDEEFGDFSNFSESDSQPLRAAVEERVASPLDVGPQFERSKMVFTRIQALYPFGDIDASESTDIDDVRPLKTFIVRHPLISLCFMRFYFSTCCNVLW